MQYEFIFQTLLEWWWISWQKGQVILVESKFVGSFISFPWDDSRDDIRSQFAWHNYLHDTLLNSMETWEFSHCEYVCFFEIRKISIIFRTSLAIHNMKSQPTFAYFKTTMHQLANTQGLCGFARCLADSRWRNQAEFSDSHEWFEWWELRVIFFAGVHLASWVKIPGISMRHLQNVQCLRSFCDCGWSSSMWYSKYK